MIVDMDTVLANLDWLILHKGMRLDYAAGAVLDEDGEPQYLLEDLALSGLTPATERRAVRPVLWDVSALIGHRVHLHVTEGKIDRMEIHD